MTIYVQFWELGGDKKDGRLPNKTWKHFFFFRIIRTNGPQKIALKFKLGLINFYDTRISNSTTAASLKSKFLIS